MIVYSLVFVYGLLIGSFLNVLIYRIPRDESIVFPGSHCPVCDHKLKWYDNIPLFSYLSLKGKCRYCGTKISSQYPIIEFFNAFTYIVLLYILSFGTEFLFMALLSSVMLVIAVIDFKEQIIPDVLVLSILILSILYRAADWLIYGVSFDILDSFLGALIPVLIFLLIILVSKGGMGGGDVTLVAAIGFILGRKSVLLCIMLSFVLGAIISLILLATKLKTRKDAIPFGPFLILGFYLTYFFGDQILMAYLAIIF